VSTLIKEILKPEKYINIPIKLVIETQHSLFLAFT